ncbi:SgcJ/EcaC family oxidoreductase [Streptomyces bobili]|uniref:SgcJ/EcaC family oxidoreductase n=1 Tax=Streptomyces bobili TaxID=67280 RepID=UPI00371F462E
MAAGFASFLKGTTTTNRQLGIRFLGRDGAIVVSESGILFPCESEVPADRIVYATWVLEKRDDAWLIAAYHNSPVSPPADPESVPPRVRLLLPGGPARQVRAISRRLSSPSRRRRTRRRPGRPRHG